MTIEKIRESINIKKMLINYYDSNSKLPEFYRIIVIKDLEAELKELENLICPCCGGEKVVAGTVRSSRQVNPPEDVPCTNCNGTGVK